MARKEFSDEVIAIDRLVHHRIILELNLPSYRLEAAQFAQKRQVTPEPRP